MIVVVGLVGQACFSMWSDEGTFEGAARDEGRVNHACLWEREARIREILERSSVETETRISGEYSTTHPRPIPWRVWADGGFLYLSEAKDDYNVIQSSRAESSSIPTCSGGRTCTISGRGPWGESTEKLKGIGSAKG